MLPFQQSWMWSTPGPSGPAPTISSATVAADGDTFTTVWSAAVNHSASSVSLSGGRTATYQSGDGTDTIVWHVAPQVYLGNLVTWTAGTGAVVDASSSVQSQAVSSGAVTNNSTIPSPSARRTIGRLGSRGRPNRLARV